MVFRVHAGFSQAGRGWCGDGFPVEPEHLNPMVETNLENWTVIYWLGAGGLAGLLTLSLIAWLLPVRMASKPSARLRLAIKAFHYIRQNWRLATILVAGHAGVQTLALNLLGTGDSIAGAIASLIVVYLWHRANIRAQSDGEAPTQADGDVLAFAGRSIVIGIATLAIATIFLLFAGGDEFVFGLITSDDPFREGVTQDRGIRFALSGFCFVIALTGIYRFLPAIPSAAVDDVMTMLGAAKASGRLSIALTTNLLWSFVITAFMALWILNLAPFYQNDSPPSLLERVGFGLIASIIDSTILLFATGTVSAAHCHVRETIAGQFRNNYPGTRTKTPPG